MALVNYTLELGTEPTLKEQRALWDELDAASKHPYEYDPDCPLLTGEQLAQFHPANDLTGEAVKTRHYVHTMTFDELDVMVQ